MISNWGVHTSAKSIYLFQTFNSIRHRLELLLLPLCIFWMSIQEIRQDPGMDSKVLQFNARGWWDRCNRGYIWLSVVLLWAISLLSISISIRGQRWLPSSGFEEWNNMAAPWRTLGHHLARKIGHNWIGSWPNSWSHWKDCWKHWIKRDLRKKRKGRLTSC